MEILAMVGQVFDLGSEFLPCKLTCFGDANH